MNLTEQQRELIQQADVVFLQDIHDDENRELVFGRQMLARIVAEGRTMEAKVCVIPIDFNTDALEYYLAAVQLLKGHHEYQNKTILN